MPRPELFFLLACAFALAIMSGAPSLPTRTLPVTIASLSLADEAGLPRTDSGILQHSLGGR